MLFCAKLLIAIPCATSWRLAIATTLSTEHENFSPKEWPSSILVLVCLMRFGLAVQISTLRLLGPELRCVTHSSHNSISAQASVWSSLTPSTPLTISNSYLGAELKLRCKRLHGMMTQPHREQVCSPDVTLSDPVFRRTWWYFDLYGYSAGSALCLVCRSR